MYIIKYQHKTCKLKYQDQSLTPKRAKLRLRNLHNVYIFSSNVMKSQHVLTILCKNKLKNHIAQYCPVLPISGVLPSPGKPGFSHMFSHVGKPGRSILCQPWMKYIHFTCWLSWLLLVNKTFKSHVSLISTCLIISQSKGKHRLRSSPCDLLWLS